MSLRDDVIAAGYALDRRGWCHCPFHQPDKTPSFHVFIASRGKHKGEEIFYCQGCGALGDAADWKLFVTGRKGKLPKEDPEVRHVRLADERVRKERDRLWLAFIRNYPDTPDEIFDSLETVQTRLNAVRLGS